MGLDVLTDAVRNSVFDPEEVTREREVVLEEQFVVDCAWNTTKLQGCSGGEPGLAAQQLLKQRQEGVSF